MRRLIVVALVASCAICCTTAIRPKFSWDTVGNLTFFHSCNESGLFSDEALDTIVKFPLVSRTAVRRSLTLVR